MGGGNGARVSMSKRTLRRLIFLAYVLIGIVIAWDRGYITVALLKALASALLAILLWWLVLLGVNLHIH
jgi:energy-converting hydrogenase Eha subunit C